MFKKLTKLFLVFTLSVQVSGCVLLAGAAAGAGGVIWAQGRLQQELSASLDRAHSATISALKNLELPISIDQKDALTAKVQSKFSDGTNVWIDLDYLTKDSTRTTIRVGVVGDQERSNKILETIKKYL